MDIDPWSDEPHQFQLYDLVEAHCVPIIGVRFQEVERRLGDSKTQSSQLILSVFINPPESDFGRSYFGNFPKGVRPVKRDATAHL